METVEELVRSTKELRVRSAELRDHARLLAERALIVRTDSYNLRHSMAAAKTLSPRKDGMDWNIIEDRWHEYKGAAKRRWDKLSEAQLTGTRGNREYLVKRVQEAYALTREEAEREIEIWQATQFDRRTPAANGS